MTLQTAPYNVLSLTLAYLGDNNQKVREAIYPYFATAEVTAVIFLDIHGVVNKRGTWDVNALQNLSKIMSFSKVPGIVITSALRIGKTPMQLRQDFSQHKFSLCIIDKIQDPYKKNPIWRGQEIRLWLQTHPDVKHFVILDDTDDHIYHYFGCQNLDGKGHFVIVYKSALLTQKDVQSARNALAVSYSHKAKLYHS